MAVTYRSIVVLIQIVSISCGSLDLLTDNISGAVGERVEIKWRLKFDQGESIGDSLFRVCPDDKYEKCFVSGDGKNFAVREVSSPFKDRVVAKYEEGLHVLIINNLNMTDEGRKIYPQAIFRKNAVDVTNIVKEELTIQVKAYPQVIRSLPLTLYFNESNTPTLHIVASGIPKPTVTWKFQDQTIQGSYVNNSNYEYTYELKMTSLSRQSCGHRLHYEIRGWNNSVINGTSTVYVNFTLGKLVVNVDDVTENMIRVSWDEVDSGQCYINYTVYVFDNSLKLMQSIQATRQLAEITFSSPEERRNATIVKVTASYLGQQSSSEKDISSLPTQPPTITKKEEDSESSSSSTPVIIGVVAGVIVVIVIIIVIVFYMKKKNEKKSHSSVGSAQGADNSYNHIPMDNRDGAQENSYTTGPSKPPSRENDPDQMLYAELGAGGGRTGPKPAPEQSNYAVVKVDDMGYPARGPTSDKKPQPTYAAVNRDRSRRHSPPPPDDDNEGVIV